MDVLGLLKKAAEKTGFTRERYDERRVPLDANRITVLPFFGDIRSLFVLSSLILKRYREEEKGSRYFVLCSWPGYQSLFPFVDEYWGIQDETLLRKFYSEANNFRNSSDLTATYYRNLNQYFFEDVVPIEEITKYYDNGITNEFWKKYKQIKRSLPAVPSSSILGKDFNRELAHRGGFKIFVSPTQNLIYWRSGLAKMLPIRKEFWVYLLHKLVENKFVPVVNKDYLSHDVSGDLVEKCIYTTETDAANVLSIMRATGCVLDIFNDTSRLALTARCPFLSVVERARFATLKEYEIDDLCGKNIPKQYIFSFPTIIEGGGPDTWSYNIVNSIISRLNAFLPDLNRDEWPSTGESTELVSYDAVRKIKTKRFGTKLLKVPRD